MQLEARTTALVLIDLQKGVLGMPVAPHTATEVFDRSMRLAQRCREVGTPVVRVRVSFAADLADAPQNLVDQPSKFASLPPGWDEFPDALAPTDIVVTKRQWGAFYGTDLDLQLRRRGIKRVVLGGIATNIGVESTARSAAEHGYELVIPEDLCAGVDAQMHAFSFQYILPRLARITTGPDHDFGGDQARMNCARFRPAAWPAPVQWVALLLLSALISALWAAAGLPAALLLGPMLGGVVFGVNGLRLRVPAWPYLGAQGIIGAMVSMAITPAIVGTLGTHLVLFGIIMATTLLGAAAIGWLISRTGLIPGATAVYGTSPGAASAMVLLGEAQGADTQLVAFMQYSRVLLVALAAALVAHFWAGGVNLHTPGTSWFAAVQWGHLAVVLVIGIAGQQLARFLRLPAWPLLGPMLLLATLHASGWLAVDLPRWLLAAAYALLGWHIGLGFRRDALRHAGRAVPVVAAAALCTMALCGLLAWCLTHLAHVDALTAYLATSPGGVDSVAIIAASTPRVDLPFVLALQSVRLLFVIGLAPLVTRLVVRHSPHLQAVGSH